MAKQIAKVSLDFTGLYESELLTELMLRFWNHPNADDADFRNTLLETAAEALRAAVAGQQLIEGLAPNQMNLVSASRIISMHAHRGVGQFSEIPRFPRVIENYFLIQLFEFRGHLKKRTAAWRMSIIRSTSSVVL